MTITNPAVADGLESIIRSVPGVTTIYPAAPILKTIATSIISAAIPSVANNAPIVFADSDTEQLVSIHIGIGTVDPAMETARNVYDAAADYFRATGALDTIINVRIGSIG